MASTEEQLRPDRAAVIALFGPTSVGKSEVAVAISELLAKGGQRSVVIAADSMQIYDGLELLSGAASAEQRSRADHRLIGCVSLQEEFSVADYAKLAHAEIDAALAANTMPIVVGGTGLYLQAALTEMPLRPQLSPEIEAALALRLETEGAALLHAELAKSAPAAANRISVNDHRRLLRALALLREGHAVDDQPGGIWSSGYRHPTRLIGLLREREDLYARIDKRVDQIAASGAPQEIASARVIGASRTAQMALGFRELQDGDLEAMKTKTRRYAKRQMTWLRRLDDAEIFECGGLSAGKLAAQILGSSVSAP